MLKDSDKPRYASRRTHRTYTAQFKAELVAACKEPGASIAAVAGAHGMNANVLHRWLKEQGGVVREERPTFIPVALPVAAQLPAGQNFKVEVRKGALVMTITWPASAAGEFAHWAASILK
jgi:transposase-like protein